LPRTNERRVAGEVSQARAKAINAQAKVGNAQAKAGNAQAKAGNAQAKASLVQAKAGNAQAKASLVQAKVSLPGGEVDRAQAKLTLVQAKVSLPRTQEGMVQEMVEKVVQDYFAGINALDAEAWLATFAADATSYEPGQPPLNGHEALRAFFNGVAGGFSRLHFQADETFVVGPEAAVRWSARGTGHNGKEAAFAGIDVFTINGAGLIQTVRAYWDPAAMIAQLQD
jgi:steroid delta-isomerase